MKKVMAFLMISIMIISLNGCNEHPIPMTRILVARDLGTSLVMEINDNKVDLFILGQGLYEVRKFDQNTRIEEKYTITLSNEEKKIVSDLVNKMTEIEPDPKESEAIMYSSDATEYQVLLNDNVYRSEPNPKYALPINFKQQVVYLTDKIVEIVADKANIDSAKLKR